MKAVWGRSGKGAKVRDGNGTDDSNGGGGELLLVLLLLLCAYYPECAHS